jgi:hypothetical protein
MASDSAIKFSFSFSLAVLFHLFLLALVLLSLSVEPTIPLKKPIAAMQATLLDASQLLNQENNSHFQTMKLSSRSDEKRQERIEKEKILVTAAQKMLFEAMQEEQSALVQKTELNSNVHTHKTH